MSPALRQWAGRLLPVVLLLIAGFVLWREFRDLDLAAVMARIRGWGPGRLAAATALTLLSYGLLAAMEWLGLRSSGARVPFGDTLLGSFCANAFAHSIGMAVLVGGVVRVRLYARHGATLMMVAQTSVFCAVSFGLGIIALAGAAILLSPDLPIAGLRLHPVAGLVVGGLLLAAPVVYVVACGLFRGSLAIFGHALRLPTLGAALGQVALGLVDNAVTAMVIWVLLPGQSIDYPAFAAAYVLATLLGIVSTVPGGAGVFEGAVLALLPGLARAPLAAAFIGYRLIYFVIPLGIAALILIRSGLMPKPAASTVPV